MSTNLPLGTYVPDGLRSGPSYHGYTSANGFVPTNFGNYGPGILYSPQFTWNIKPALGTSIDIVALTNANAIAGAGYLTLAGGAANGATKLVPGITNRGTQGQILQFDWPRVPVISVATANLLNAVTVTIFGTDWYGQPLQHNYPIQNVATYPSLVQVGVRNQDFSIPVKAFYTITGAYISGAPGNNNGTISIGTTIGGAGTAAPAGINIYGLPYLIDKQADIIAIGWGNFNDYGVAALNNNNGYGNVPCGVFKAGSSAAATATTEDVRGIYCPSTVGDGTPYLRFTYYVDGADVWANQVAAAQTAIINNGGQIVGNRIGPLVASDLYGVPQYYVGTPT